MLLTVLPGNLLVSTECHILVTNTIVVQLADGIVDTSILQRSTHFQIPLTSVHFVTDNATHALASTVTVMLTFNDEEEDVVISNRWTPEDKEQYFF